MCRPVTLTTVQLSALALYGIDCAQHPTATISDSLYGDRAFCLLVSFFVWVHLSLLAARHSTLVGVFSAAAAVGWFLVVAFDNRTGSVLHAVGVVAFAVAVTIAVVAAFPRFSVIAGADFALALVYMGLSVTHSPHTAPVQRVAFAGLVVFLVAAVQWDYVPIY